MRYAFQLGIFVLTLIVLSGCSTTPVEVTPYVASDQDVSDYENVQLLRKAQRHSEAKSLFMDLVNRGYPPALRDKVAQLLKEDAALKGDYLYSSGLADTVGSQALVNWANEIKAADSGVCQALEGLNIAWYHHALRQLAQQGDLAAIYSNWQCEKQYTRPLENFKTETVQLMVYAGRSDAYSRENRLLVVGELYDWYQAQLIQFAGQRDLGLKLLTKARGDGDKVRAGMAEWAKATVDLALSGEQLDEQTMNLLVTRLQQVARVQLQNGDTAAGKEWLAYSINVAQQIKTAFPNQSPKADSLIAECQAMLKGLAIS
ncbi:hypothetical protein [Marinobacter sp. CHS3-4]|uniref:hypothetical protein n=1 Tax=Marinobacter sp. CHS3-4 TaxID=3045174 RepID=UPI0024B60BA0|nr:hypothetical protein [Marinobacter sp. CHS3-4]MDI9244541.1 hypothetical protein [Marinobacter sp. CHS3-4]